MVLLCCSASTALIYFSICTSPRKEWLFTYVFLLSTINAHFMRSFSASIWCKWSKHTLNHWISAVMATKKYQKKRFITIKKQHKKHVFTSLDWVIQSVCCLDHSTKTAFCEKHTYSLHLLNIKLLKHFSSARRYCNPSCLFVDWFFIIRPLAGGRLAGEQQVGGRRGAHLAEVCFF